MAAWENQNEAKKKVSWKTVSSNLASIRQKTIKVLGEESLKKRRKKQIWAQRHLFDEKLEKKNFFNIHKTKKKRDSAQTYTYEEKNAMAQLVQLSFQNTYFLLCLDLEHFSKYFHFSFKDDKLIQNYITTI